jgi:3-hydroxyisobutyrate dehydrogenase
MAKDVGLATGLAAALDRPLEIGDHVATQWRRIAREVSPATDHTQMYTLLGATQPESPAGGAR